MHERVLTFTSSLLATPMPQGHTPTGSASHSTSSARSSSSAPTSTPSRPRKSRSKRSTLNARPLRRRKWRPRRMPYRLLVSMVRVLYPSPSPSRSLCPAPSSLHSRSASSICFTRRILTRSLLLIFRSHATSAHDATFTSSSLFEAESATAASFCGLMRYFVL